MLNLLSAQEQGGEASALTCPGVVRVAPLAHSLPKESPMVDPGGCITLPVSPFACVPVLAAGSHLPADCGFQVHYNSPSQCRQQDSQEYV